MIGDRPRAPVFLDHVLDDPGLVRRLVEADAPHQPVQRYFANEAEYAAASGRGPMIVAPNFRGDWAYDGPLVEGVEPILRHEGFADAARRMFDADVVRPQIVYANLTWQLPFPQGAGHTDVPAFRGVDRTRTPIWLLNVMGHSRLFEAERVNIATAVAWFYEGTDGGFTYWPDGPDRPPQMHEGRIHNTAIVGDNDFMFHRVNPVGRPADGLPRGLTLDTVLRHRGGDAWSIEEAGRVLAEPRFEQLRISVSWKALVFRDAQEARVYDEKRDDLTLDAVFERLRDDLDWRGAAFAWPADPLRDAGLVSHLADVYVREPSIAA